MPLSLAEHAGVVVGIDPVAIGSARPARSSARERRLRQSALRAAPTAWPCRSRTGRSISCCRMRSSSTSPTPPGTCAECRRVLARRRPLLPVDGAVPVVRRRAPAAAAGAGAAAPDRRPGRRVPHVPLLARHAPWTLREPAHENSFIRDARRGIDKHDDLLEKVRVRAAAATDRAAPACEVVREELHVTATVRRLPAPDRTLARATARSRRTRSSVISSTCWRPPEAARPVHHRGTHCTHGRNRPLPPGGPPPGRGAVPAGLRTRRRRGQPAALGLAVPPATRTCPADGPLIWIAREGTHDHRPVRHHARPRSRVSGREIDASWGMDVMVAPERQRQGLGDVAVPHVGPRRRAPRSASACRTRRTACSRRCTGPTSARCPAWSSR